MTEERSPIASSETTRTLTLQFGAGQSDYARLFLHALAQTSDAQHLALSGLLLDSLQPLVSAYGLERRVHESSTGASAQVVRSPDEFRVHLRTASTGDLSLRLLSEIEPRLTLAEIVESLTPPDAPASRLPGAAGLEGERVAVITNIPNHYRVPLFNALDKEFESVGASLLVLFLGRTYGRRSWVDLPEMTFDHVFLDSIGVKLSRAWHPFIPKDLEKNLRGFVPTTVICGGFSPLVAGRAARFARRNGAKFAIWSGETSTGITGANRLRMLQRRVLLKRADVGLSYGSRAEDYLVGLRPDLPVVHVRNTIPTIPGNQKSRDDKRTIGLLAVAESRAGKRLDLVIDAAAACVDLDWHLTIVGDGPSRASLEARAGPLGDRVTFTGAVPSSQIGDYYDRADIFLFPSEIDVFGLVVVEAFGAGLATLVSRDPGAVADLCADGMNSIVVPDQSVGEWGRCLRAVITDEALRGSLGHAARRTIANRWTIEHSAAAFLAGVRAAPRNP